MAAVFFITHPDVEIDPAAPVPDWRLNVRGLARMRALLGHTWVTRIKTVASSAERKAIEGAEILASHLGLPFIVHSGLGENDRSATGYLPRPDFEAMADAFFAQPETSVHGWERAVDAQTRIVTALREVLAAAPAGDVALVSHGGVGALLLCHARGEPIGRANDQPVGTGGYYFVLERDTAALIHGWRTIDP